MFKTTGVEAPKDGVSMYAEPGTVQEMAIVDITFDNAGKTPFLEITASTIPVEGVTKHDYGTGRIVNKRYWLSEKAYPWTMQAMAIIGDKLNVRKELDAGLDSALTEEQGIDVMKKVFYNRFALWTITGREYSKKEGGVGVANDLPFFRFIHSLDERERAAQNMANLIKGEKHIERLVVNEKTPVVSTSESAADITGIFGE